MERQDKELNLNYKREINRRINFFIYIIILIFIVIVGRLFYLQIIDGDKWRQAGQDQYFKELGEDFNRGAIYFSNKNGVITPAVEMFNKYDLAIDPRTLKSTFENQINQDNQQDIKDFEIKIYNNLKNIFDDYNQESNPEKDSTSTKLNFIDYDTFNNKFQKEDSAYEVLATDIPENIALKIKDLNYRGVIVQVKKSRVYYEKSLAAKVLGFVGFNKNKKTGLYGLEEFYNDVLDKSNLSNSNFFAEAFSDLNLSLSDLKKKSISNGNRMEGDLQLTIDINVEKYLNKELQNTMNK